MSMRFAVPPGAAGRGHERAALRVAIAVITVLFIAAFWITAITLGRTDRERTLAAVDVENRNLARTLGEHAARTLDYADRVALEVKARHEQSGRGLDLERYGRDGGINRRIVRGVVIANSRGDLVQGDAAPVRNTNIADREHFRVHVVADGGRPYVSRPVLGRTQHRLNIIVSRRLNRRGAFDGIVGVAIDPDVFTGFYRDTGLGEKGLIVLTGLDGFIRARGSDAGEAGGQDVRGGQLFPEYTKRDAGIARYRSVLDGVTRRVAFRRLDNYPLVMAVGVAEETVLAAVYDRARTLYAGAAIASALALLAAAALLVMLRRRDQDARALEESGARFRQVTENIGDVFWLTDPDKHELLYASPAYERVWGRSLDNVYRSGLEWIEGIHADDRERVLHAARTRQISGDYDEQYRVVRPDGSIRWVRDRAFPVRDAAGRVVRIAGVAEDITAVRELEQSYQRMVEASPDATFINRDDVICYANPAALKMLRAESAGLVIGSSPLDIIHPDDRAAAGERIARSRAGEEQVALHEQRFLALDGTVVETEVSVALIREHGRVARQVVARDVTQRKKTEAAMRESEARLRVAVEAAGMTDWEWDVGADTTRWGHQHERLLGPLPPGAARYPDFRDMVHADDRARFLAAGRATLEEGLPYEIEFRFVRTDGRLCWLRHSGRAVRDVGGRIVRMVGVTQDVTRRHDIERELVESQQRRDALLESNPDPAWLKDCEGRYIAANRAWFRRHGMAPHDIKGKTDYDFFSAERARIVREEDRRVIETQAPVRVERDWTFEDAVEWIEAVKAPVLDSTGRVAAIIGISHDISERKRNEQAVRQMNESLAQKTGQLTALNKELEAFSYSVSHDLRAPLRSISGFGNFLLKDNFDQLDAAGREKLRRILAATARMGRLIDDLLKLARISRQAMSVRQVRLHALAAEIVAGLREAGAPRQVEVVIGEDLTVEADAGLMRVVLDNLLGNAWKFTGGRDDARIEFGSQLTEGRPTYYVRDNGAGFDMSYAGKLFAPFQRMHTQQQFEGTGIGLATVKRIIERHQGRIWIESAVGRGTTVFFTVGATA